MSLKAVCVCECVCVCVNTFPKGRKRKSQLIYPPQANQVIALLQVPSADLKLLPQKGHTPSYIPFPSPSPSPSPAISPRPPIAPPSSVPLSKADRIVGKFTEHPINHAVFRPFEKSYFLRIYQTHAHLKTDTNSNKLAALRGCLERLGEKAEVPGNVDADEHAITLWTGDLYTRINTALIQDNPDEIEKLCPLIRLMNNYIVTHPSTKKMTLYRGTTIRDHQKVQVQKDEGVRGTVWRQPLFVAASEDMNLARRFRKEGCPIIEFVVPIDCYNCTPVHHLSIYPEEKEWLMPPYTPVKYKGQRNEGGCLIVTVDVLDGGVVSREGSEVLTCLIMCDLADKESFDRSLLPMMRGGDMPMASSLFADSGVYGPPKPSLPPAPASSLAPSPAPPPALPSSYSSAVEPPSGTLRTSQYKKHFSLVPMPTSVQHLMSVAWNVILWMCNRRGVSREEGLRFLNVRASFTAFVVVFFGYFSLIWNFSDFFAIFCFIFRVRFDIFRTLPLLETLLPSPTYRLSPIPTPHRLLP